MGHQRVVAVMVTWNRRDLLAEALTAVGAQSRPIDALVVVDNGSTDGTADLLTADFPAASVVTSRRNTGGAGGFAIGIGAALDRGADLVWLMDDDTVPHAGALEALLAAAEGYPGPTPSLVASRVVWTDGRDHPMNTPRCKPGARRDELADAAAVGCIPVRSASFVSVLVDAGAIRERGLPIADYFLWNDDFEFTTRVLRGRVGLASADSVVTHKTARFGATDADPGERFFYEVRNKVWLFTRSAGLAPSEKVLYGASTARRWLRTVARSADRRVLLSGLRRGLWAGLRAGPRPNPDVLAGAVDEALHG